MPRKAKKKKDEPMKKTLVILAALFCLLLLPGCSQKSKLCNQIQDALAEEKLEDLRITVYFANPWICFRAPLSVEDLINWIDNQEDGIMMYRLEGQDCFDSVQVIRDQLRPDGVEPIEQTKFSYVNARVYYVLEDKNGDKILELLLDGVDPRCILLNGTPVAYSAVFYDIIQPCVGFQWEDLRWYFASVIEPPTYEHKPSEYPNSVWVCEDPKITLYVREDGSSVCKFGEPSDEAVETEPCSFNSHNSQFYMNQLECRCVFSPETMTATVSKDERFDGKYVGQQIVFVRKEG